MLKENKLLSHCPTKRELELFTLGAGLSRAEKFRVQKHLSGCRCCLRFQRNLDRFYTLLAAELQKPVTNPALDLAKSLAPKKVCYGLLLCSPVRVKHRPREKAYRTHLVFSANGGAGLTRLRDFDLLKIPKEYLAIRLYSDPSFKEMSLFLWQHEVTDLSICQLRWSDAGNTVSFSPTGRSRMTLTDFKTLDNRLIYFSTAAGKKRKAGCAEAICGRMHRLALF